VSIFEFWLIIAYYIYYINKPLTIIFRLINVKQKLGGKMKKILCLFMISGMLMTASYNKAAAGVGKNQTVQSPPESCVKPFQTKEELSSKTKEILEIQRKMFDIEKTAINQDRELKQMAEQIKTLQKQMRARLEANLRDNKEYQLLKQRRDEIKTQYIKSHQEKMKKFPPPSHK